MRHLPLVGHLPTSPFVTRYLVIKQDNNGDTFLIGASSVPAELLDHAAEDEVAPGPIGAWSPTDPDDDHGAPHIIDPEDIDSTEPVF